MKFPKLPKFMDKKNVSKMLENKYVLYFVFILAIINLFGYMITGNFNSIIFFVLVGFLTTFFSKNMILILTVPLVLTSVLMVGKTVKESFETASKSKNTSTIDEQIKELQKEIDDMIESGISTDADKADFKKKNDKLQKLMATRDSTKNTTVTGGDSSGATATKDDADNTMDTPKKSKSESMSTMYNKSNRIDYASTVEDAYEDLNKILGGNGIKQLTDDTQKLMQQQLQLADAMKSMSPLMDQAKNLLQGFDLKNLSSLTNVGKNLQMPVDGN
jgi:hypothetical protein